LASSSLLCAPNKSSFVSDASGNQLSPVEKRGNDMITNRIDCIIERRLLVNYRIEPEVVAAQLPSPFRPQLVSGWAVGGVCFLRLRDVRPASAPAGFGLTTENVAHRFAVEWDDVDGRQVGVYVPRRDTGSRLASWSGGRFFPGVYHAARFDSQDLASSLSIDVTSRDGEVRLSVSAQGADGLGGQLFKRTEDAARFFREGALGYSPAGGGDYFEGVRLMSSSWDIAPVSVDYMASSLFDNQRLFPKGTCTLDSGLVMRDLPVRWLAQRKLLPRSTVVVA
jgi:hypothetical protein